MAFQTVRFVKFAVPRNRHPLSNVSLFEPRHSTPVPLLAASTFPTLFPDFWGWGGEDDEIYSRMLESGLLPADKVPYSVSQSPGCIEDLEATLIRERGGERAGTSVKDGGRTEWRNMWKRENLARHAATWRSNGVGRVDFRVLATRSLGPDVTVVTVDLLGAEDPQAQRQVHTEPQPEEGRGGGKR